MEPSNEANPPNDYRINLCKQQQLITINLFVSKGNQDTTSSSSQHNSGQVPEINLRLFLERQRSREEDSTGSGTNSNVDTGTETAKNSSDDETSSDSNSSSGGEILEMESPKVSKQDAGGSGTNSNAVEGMALENNTTDDETLPMLQPDHLSRNGAEITEMESTKVSNEDNWSTYLRLCKMIEENDWEVIEYFLGKHPEALTDNISQHNKRIFDHIVLFLNDDEQGVARLIKKLAPKIDRRTLEKKETLGLTFLNLFATLGNTSASQILVKHNPGLPNIQNDDGLLPVHTAAYYGHKDTVQYLIKVTADDHLNGRSGASLILALIESNFYDIALDFMKRYPAIFHDDINFPNIVLHTLARKPLAFASGRRLGRLQRCIYNCIPVKKKNISSIDQMQNNKYQSEEEDLENLVGGSKNHSSKSASFGCLGQMNNTTSFVSICQELYSMFWNTLGHLVPRIKAIHDQKLAHMEAVEIVRMICKIVTWNNFQTFERLITTFHTAARFGISEIVNEIIRANNQSIHWKDKDGFNVFQVAIFHRREKVFNLIYRFRFVNHILIVMDENDNNLLHLAGKLVVPSTEIAGAALQMQRELQWFKVLEDLMRPADNDMQNRDHETPRELFTKAHKNLVTEGEIWIKKTATSCTVAVTLIITVVFAAAFTVPGGNNTSGLPNFLNDQTFLVFAVFDALALFSSITSLLMFLGILTSRYAEEDFLVSLPRKLIIGLITLFLSVASMLVAFGATIYIVLFQPWKWVIIPIALLGCVPVTLFAFLQFPLLLDMILSTYGPSIFGPK